MIVCLIKKNQIFNLTLPEKVNGQFWLKDFDDEGAARRLISVEADENEWWIKSNKNVVITDINGVPAEKYVLSPDQLLFFKIGETSEEAILFVEALDETRQSLYKINVNSAVVLTIGQAEDNNICYNNAFVSTYHAKLSYDGKNWMVTDLGSRNGTYVNGLRAESVKLIPGDLIFIMELRIIVGDGFFAINNPDMRVRLRSDKLSKYIGQKIKRSEKTSETVEKKYFSRSPRFRREIKCEDLEIDPPSAPINSETVPIALMLGPSLTMGITSLSTGIFSVMNAVTNNGNITQALPALIMSVSMLAGTALWPFLTKKYERKRKIKNEEKRREKYFYYLSEIEDKIKEIAKLQSDILNETYVSPEECFERVFEKKPNLWERTADQKDFLMLRLGTGTVGMSIDLKFQKKKFTIDDDSLQNAMLALAEEKKELKDVPITISLADRRVVGIYGKKRDRNDLVKSLILQIVSLHGYDDVRLVMISDEADEAEWGFVRYLPHIWNDNKSVRFFAQNQDEVSEISSILQSELLPESNDSEHGGKAVTPYYVCFITSSALRKKFPALERLIKDETVRFSAVVTGDSFNNFPKETRIVIHANGADSIMFDKDDTSGERCFFSADSVDGSALDDMAAALANIELDINGENYVLPNVLTFLEMFNVGKVEHLNILTRWKENNPTKSLKTPVGVGTDGDIFMLDLHEKQQGPHGLVAGMTGSGKSEFIITYILSLAVNYHPDEVAFILIDYKGGGLAGAFENSYKGTRLPHLVGTITNLEGSSITRSLASIQSELRRRQKIFNEARKTSNEGTMDIYKYQQLYREKKVSEPMPHLFIISDEFAELKAQQPEFMDQLISAARIGRSLGVHLILATQKPSGVVDDQIWSNTRFRVCLKVQEKSDSQEMIKCPDAAMLSQTGRFYLQVGFNEYFALGQSAWSGAEYIPTDTVSDQSDLGIEVVDCLGRSIINIKPEKKVESKTKIKQIVATVEYLSKLAAEEGIEKRSLWLDPIPPRIFVEQLEKKYSAAEGGYILCPIVGEYDDPFNQKQSVLRIPLSEDGNCLIFGATGSGKTTFITTICYSLIKNHTPDEVNLYLIDYGSETLKAFEKAPHVGGVVTSADEEKCVKLLQMLQKELKRRRDIFSPFGGDYASYCRNSGQTLPNIVVVLNNLSGFNDQMDDYREDFALLTREGVKYGIYFVVTVPNTNSVRYAIQQNFKILLTLQLNDASDYHAIVGRTEGVVPSKFKGRGLVAIDRVYEFQTAFCTDESDLQKFLRTFCAELSSRYTSSAEKIPMLPETVDIAFVEKKITELSCVPIGVARESLEIVTFDFMRKPTLPVIARDISVIAGFAGELSSVLSRICTTVVIDVEKMLGDCAGLSYVGDISEIIEKIYYEMAGRSNLYKRAEMDASVLKEYDERCYLFFGIKKLFERLEEEKKAHLKEMLERADPIFKIHFVMCESAQQIKTFQYETWYKKNIGDDGIWIGDGVADRFFSLNSVTKEMKDMEHGTEFGYMINSGRSLLVKLLSPQKEGEKTGNA